LLEGYRQLRATGAGLRAPYYLTLIAEACGRAGDAAAGLEHIEQARRLVETGGERWAQPELERVRAGLLRLEGRLAEAAVCEETALRVAKRMGARAWELRARPQSRTASERS
jgi:hypothetical protein